MSLMSLSMLSLMLSSSSSFFLIVVVVPRTQSK
jgi:hypothetical protein